MTRRSAGRRSGLAVLAAWLLAAAPAAALTLLPLDLPALTTGAGRIFVGRVEQIASGRDARGMPAVWTTFAIDDTLKGATETRVTLKQLGTALADAVVPHASLPRYRTGETVLLFLHAESELGFTSPVGLAQGVFRVSDRAGRRVAENDVGNRNLAEPSAAAAAARTAATAASAAVPGAVPFDELVGRVRALVDATP